MSERAGTLDMDALVLAGGESRRMGASKAALPFGEGTLAGAVVSTLRPLFGRVLVVARESQGWLGEGVELLTDDRPERGPLVGLARGLGASEAAWCFVVGCDMPFLRPEVILRMAERLDGCDVLAPSIGGRVQPLHVFYSQRCLAPARRLLDSGVTSLGALLRLCRVRTVAASDFLDLDHYLMSFRDVDTREEYEAARELAFKLRSREVAR